MKKLAHILLCLGVALVLLGGIAWQADRRSDSLKLFLLVFPVIPGWACVIMGWTALLADRIREELKEK